MNNFTKEELKFIAVALERFAVKDSELLGKLQSMIDSYCEHKWTVLYINGSANVRCKKCNSMPRTIE